MSGVSGPSRRKPAASMEHRLPVLLQCAEQLHVHVPPDACAIEIDSTPSAVGTVVGTAVVGVGVGAAVPAKRLYGPCVLTGVRHGAFGCGCGAWLARRLWRKGRTSEAQRLRICVTAAGRMRVEEELTA